MERIVSVTQALRCAVQTAQEQPREVPAAPEGWFADAQDALAKNDDTRIRASADAILRAHSQHRAEFDIKGWLFDLRNAVHSAPAHAAATRAMSRVVEATRQAMLRK